ncbi:hypothetical protein BKA70DRAFT_684698 [Coprinopsis sp. MPI-PUGE-AT-0042]|nr:hypothetical protein BKA70DRAFT_684698 [Coprinopsis sp. MPI-PUGE-AT-0042]
MNANGIEPGDYIITNLRTKAVLDAQDGKTIGYPYTMSASQTWTLATDGNFWTVQNALSKRYLGMRLTDKMKNGAGIQEVDHAFSWSLEQAADHIKIAVPYSNYILDLYGKNEVGTAAYLYESDEHNVYRKWVFSKLFRAI